MPVPWLQIVQLVPAILDVSRDLLRKSQKPPAPALKGPGASDAMAERMAALEANEQRQAELVNQMAQQIAAVSEAITVLHRRLIWVSWIAAIAIVGLAIATAIAIARGG